MLYLNRIPVVHGKFPNNETYIDFDTFDGWDRHGTNEITCMFESNDDLVNLILLKKSMDDAGFTDVGLNIPYLPYMALDRTEGKRCLGAKHVGNLINGLFFSYVKTWEAHSNVALATVDRIQDRLMSMEIARDVFANMNAEHGGHAFYVFPDAGARARYKALAGASHMSFEKARRFSDGKLEAPRLAENATDGHGEAAVIIDDLVRGGRTVSNVALEIRKLIPGCEIAFCCAHCEKTVYDGVILQDPNVHKIYTTDSLLGDQVLHEKIRIVRHVLDEAAII